MQAERIGNIRLFPAGITMRLPALIFLLIIFCHMARGADIYWIGGSGQWSDINHWSLSSGNLKGELSPTVPRSNDNVIFDSNSGLTALQHTIFIDQQAYCYNIKINDTSSPPKFSGTAVNIYGNADIQKGTVLNNILYFWSDGTVDINFNSEVTGTAPLYFTGSGTYTLSGKLAGSGMIYFLKGRLNFGSSNIATRFFDDAGCCGTVPFSASSSRILDLGSSIITLTDRNSQSNTQSPSWSYSGDILYAGSSQINLAKGAEDGYHVSFFGKSGHRYNNVSFTKQNDPLDGSPYGWYNLSANRASFNKVSFANSGFLDTDSKIDTLELSPSKICYLSGTHHIGTIISNGSGYGNFSTLAGYGGSQAVINVAKPLHLNNIKIRSIKVQSNGPSIVSNGVDEGNNSGWSFFNTPKDLYWIGGGGKWEDPSHWTTSPEGEPTGGCLPTRYDNVYFNRFSGAISALSPVTITSPDAECSSISWNGVPGIPTFRSSSPLGTLNIFGSSRWQKGMSYEIGTTVYQSLNGDNSITTNNVTIVGDTHFISSGSWKLNDDYLSPDHSILFKNGELNTDGRTVNIKNFGTTEKGLGPRILRLGTSVLNIAGNWSYIGFGGPPISLYSGESSINLSAREPYFYYDSGLSYHNISFTNASGQGRLSSLLFSRTEPCTFNRVRFAGNAIMNVGGNPTPVSFKLLDLSASGKYLLGTNMEIQVDSLTVSGSSCGGLMEIASYPQSLKARLNLVQKTEISQAKISGINAVDKSLTVFGGIDGGNNQNIFIQPAEPRNLYWVGGSGNWSDSKHWSLPSGNTAPAEACIPTALDNVFFNNNSGKDYTVLLDIAANCNSMIWEETSLSRPTIAGGKATPLNINGSLILQNGMNYHVERTNFVGDSSQNFITTNGVKMGFLSENTADKGVFFSSPNGSWVLTDSFNVKNFGVTGGTLHTNGHTINAENYCSEYSGEEKSSILDITASTVNISGYWNGSGIKRLIGDNSTINMLGLMPTSNSSGGGIYTNMFHPGNGQIYNDLNFVNDSLVGTIAGWDAEQKNSFSNVIFLGESNIGGSNHFNNLQLAANKNSHLMAGSTQNVKKLSNSSSCGWWKFDNGQSHIKAIMISQSDIELMNVELAGIEVLGGAEYKVTGIDGGNNLGWAFLSPMPKNLYWIGGDGNWTDYTHWTTNSDGTSSGGCLPTRFDNVFFNEHSGQSPSINTEGKAEFNDITWKNAPGTPSIGGTLNCYGSMILQSSLSHIGGVNFLGTKQGNILATNGAILANNYDVNFSGTGSYTLLDDMTTNSRVYFTAGTLNTNGKTVTALSFNGHDGSIANGGHFSLILGSSKIYLSDGEGWTYTGENLSAANSSIHLIGSANNFKGNDGARYHNLLFKGIGNRQGIYGSVVLDSLTLATKNTNYEIEAAKTITVQEHLNINGNNCSITGLQSTFNGIPAGLNLKGGKTSFNFISVRDINSSGLPLTVFPQGTDRGNNTNIVFLPDPGTGIGVLGPDVTVCAEQLPIVLDGSALMPNDDTKFEWINTATGEILGTDVKQQVTQSGNYRIRVLYGDQCEVSDEIKVTADPLIDIADHIQIIQPDCNVPEGKLIVEPVKDITFSVDGGRFSAVGTYMLSSGNHFIKAKNKSGCVTDALAFTIGQQPTIPVADISYGADHFIAQNFIDVILTGQTGGTFTAYPSGLDIDPITGRINLGNSAPGQTYTVTYSFNNKSCSASTSTAITLSFIPTKISYPLMDYCPIGSVAARVEGDQFGKYTSSPSGLTIDNETGKIDLASSSPGIYEVIYTYQEGGEIQSVSTVITVNPLPKVTIESEKGTEISEGQSTTLKASGAVEYVWLGPDMISGQNSALVIVSPKKTSTYKVIATNQQGCSTVEELTVRVKEDLKLVPNTIITPNGDGKNDFWNIANIEKYPNNSVRIFDRAGRLIYVKKGYTNQFDGMLNGKPLNEDAYIFLIEPGNGLAKITGTLSIIRDHR